MHTRLLPGSKWNSTKISPLRSIFWKLAKPGNLFCCLKRNNEGINCLLFFCASKSSSWTSYYPSHREYFSMLCSKYIMAQENFLVYTINTQNSPVLDITTLQRYWARPSHSTRNWFLIPHIIYFLQRGTLQESLVDCSLLHYWSPYFASAQSSF